MFKSMYARSRVQTCGECGAASASWARALISSIQRSHPIFACCAAELVDPEGATSSGNDHWGQGWIQRGKVNIGPSANILPFLSPVLYLVRKREIGRGFTGVFINTYDW